VIDEVSEAGKLSGLGPLAKKGRSKGAAVVLALQSIEGLMAACRKMIAYALLNLPTTSMRSPAKG
jgi:Type IV secretion-system coupling protein DNA-binding domain